MNELKFNSQVCTTKIQSQRLLDLGLSPYTSDMCWLNISGLPACAGYSVFEKAVDEYKLNLIPAWSLHRLIELLPQDIHLDDYADTHYYLTIDPFKVIYVNSHRLWIYQRDEGCLYDKLIDTIEWTIKNNFFNKEYLKQ